MKPMSHCRWQLGLMASLVILAGCAGSQTAQNQDGTANQSGQDQAAANDPIAALPLNPLAEEMKQELSTRTHDAKYFPPLQPILAARIDVTSSINAWRNSKPQLSGGQPVPVLGGVLTFDGLSVYLLERQGQTFVASAGIPAADGKITTRGGVWVEGMMAAGTGERSYSAILSGRVWTPRTGAIGKLDLSSPGRITSDPGFDFEAFKNSPAVIPFANGYAVNLFAERVDKDGVIVSGGKGNYVSDDGKPLYGRVICKDASGNISEIEQ